MYLKCKTGKEIHDELADVYGSSAPSYAQIKFWVGEFKRGRTSLEDEARSGRPLNATGKETCKKYRDLVYSDRRIKVEEIAQALGISHGSVSTILHDRLGMRKLTARWVPKLIPHPAYSPDLAPSDFSLFPNLKKDIRGLHFRSDEEVVTAVEVWVNGKDPDFFSSGLMVLEHRWSKYVTLEGNYIEKEEVDLNRK